MTIKLKRHAYTTILERAVHFGAGLFYSMVINHFLICNLVLIYNYEFGRIRQAPFPIVGILVLITIIHLAALLFCLVRVRWAGLGMLFALILNELVWLLSDTSDPVAFLLPFWMALIGD